MDIYGVRQIQAIKIISGGQTGTTLLDRFYEVEEHLAPHQYEAAKKDFE